MINGVVMVNPHCHFIGLGYIESKLLVVYVGALLGGIKPSQDQVPPLPQMPDKAILCYICSWSHGSFL